MESSTEQSDIFNIEVLKSLCLLGFQGGTKYSILRVGIFTCVHHFASKTQIRSTPSVPE
jgi:hypothetical protein